MSSEKRKDHMVVVELSELSIAHGFGAIWDLKKVVGNQTQKISLFDVYFANLGYDLMRSSELPSVPVEILLIGIPFGQSDSSFGYRNESTRLVL